MDSWDHYRTLLAVLEEGSLSGAARTLGLTQPTVGRHVEALESVIGIQPCNSDIASGAQDIKAGVAVIAKETGAQKVHLFGESSGALRAGVYAMLEPERVDRLSLGAFTYKGENSPTLTERGGT